METTIKPGESPVPDEPVGNTLLALNQPRLPAPVQELGNAAPDSAADELALSLPPTGQPEAAVSAEAVALPDHLQQILFRLELRVPLQRFTLRDLQCLETGALLQTEHSSARDLVLTAAGERLLLVELEAVEQQLAARVKRLV